jgi:hypothetical protein
LGKGRFLESLAHLGVVGKCERLRVAFQMSVGPKTPSIQLGSSAGGLEYQVVRKREPPIRATPA